MKQQHFEEQYRDSWDEINSNVSEGKIQYQRNFPDRYRQLCYQLALAKERRYTPDLINRLNRLVLQSHHHFYQGNQRYRHQWLRFIVWGFPSVLRANSSFVLFSILLFLGPAVLTGIVCYFNEEFIYSLMSSDQVHRMESLYDPSVEHLGRERQSDTDLMMFGHYIKNNIGISFRTFASGIVFGLGSIFFLVFNGIVIGAVAGHLTQLGFVDTFYPFVVGHGAFELTAIVFSGAAGLKLGYAVIAPGPYKRSVAIRIAGIEAIQIMYGVMIMLLIAAFIEAFWSSSSTLPIEVKYAVGAAWWLSVLAYCLFSGRYNGSKPT